MMSEHRYNKNKKDDALNKKRWDAIFYSGAEKKWGSVDEHVPEIVKLFKVHGVNSVLDLGCGAGRHLLYLAKKDFKVYGIDLSSEGIKKAKKLIARKKLSAKIKLGSIYLQLPYPDSSFDAILSIHTFHHAYVQDIRKAIKELYRVLKPNGIIFITVRKRTSKKHRHPFKIVAPHTYIPLEGHEKGIVHYLFTKNNLKKEFKKFKIHKLWIDKKNYYCLLGESKKQ